MGVAEELARAVTPEGGELVLYRRGDGVELRVDGWQLMSSAAHGSEERMAELGCAGVPEDGRVLVGGLGLGFTLRAVLERVGGDATVTVSEVIPELIEWNRELVGHFAGHPLADPRVRAEAVDVFEVMQRGGPFHAVLLDVDNGPGALSLERNGRLYGPAGLALARDALAPGGTLVLWSADRSGAFERTAAEAGLEVEVHEVTARGVAADPEHVVYLLRRAA